MTREEFQRRHSADWERLEFLLHVSSAKRKDLSPYVLADLPDLAEFDRLYRTVCKHLALARLRLYGNDLIDRLNDLALRSHHAFYGARRGYFQGILAFIAGGFAVQVRRQVKLVWLATALFLVPALAMSVARWVEPDSIYAVMGASQVRSYEQMYQPDSKYRSLERQADSDVAMFGFYIYNNIGIAFRTFAAGAALGVGSIVVLIANGLSIGGVASHLTLIGYSSTFWSFVIGHGALELTAIVLSGAAGMRLGLSVISPGRRTRVASLHHAATDSVGILIGIFCMLLAAAFIEAFWSSSDLPNGLKYAVGAALWITTIGYFVLAGRSRRPRGA